MANERIKEKLKQCQQVQGILQKIVDQTSWASDMGDFRDISEKLDDVCEAAENALEDIDEMVSYYEDKLEEFEDKLNEFVDENEVEE